jgi:TonB-dependent SusC/RagA subfamily outer membrane receptor
MRTHRFLALFVGCVSACSHPNASGERRAEPPAPATATPRSILTAEEIQRVPGRPIEQLLVDYFPGVEVKRTTSGGISVRIHGVGSVLSSNEPLFVIDGVPMPPGEGERLHTINTYDIVSIEVVKDPGGAALYGVRGANGVIIIKTNPADR